MAVHPLVLKAIAAAATDKNCWYIVAIAVLALLMPLILLVMLIAILVQLLTGANASLRDCCFTDVKIPETFTEEQVEAIEYMRESLSEIETIIDEMMKENDSVHYDADMVKAVFFSLQFGFLNDDTELPDIDLEEFTEYFENKTMDDIEDVLEDIAEDYSYYTITGNTVLAVESIYDYLNP